MDFNKRKNSESRNPPFLSLPEITPSQKLIEDLSLKKKNDNSTEPKKKQSLLFKIDFGDNPPLRDDSGLTNRLPVGNIEDLAKKHHEVGGTKGEAIEDLSFERNLELFKREEAEFLEKMKKLNFLEIEGEVSKEKTMREKNIELNLEKIMEDRKEENRNFESFFSVDNKLENFTSCRSS
jgi:hypothetical protein